MEELLGVQGKAARDRGQKGGAIGIASKKATQYAMTESSRVAFMQFMESPEFDNSLREKILRNDARLADSMLYSVQKLESVTKLFLSSDVKSIGLTNLDNNRLPKGEAFVVNGITLLRLPVSATGATPTSDEIKKAISTGWQGITGDATAVLTLKAHKREIVSDLPCYSFINATTEKVSHYKLENPRLIKDEGEIEAELMMPTMSGVAANTYIMLILTGTRVIPK
jgi:hypothetical protein